MLEDRKLFVEIEGGCNKELNVISKFVGIIVLLGSLYDLNILGICISILVLNYSTYSKHMELGESACVIQQKSLLYRDSSIYEKDSIDEVDVFINKGQAVVFLIMGDLSRKVAFRQMHKDEVVNFFEDRLKIKTNIIEM